MSIHALNAQVALPVSGATISDVVSITAVVLAVVTLVLDVTFYVLTTASVSRSEREQSRVFTEMREVLAQISERAQIVQNQVDRQTSRLIEIVATRVSTSAQAAGDQLSEQLQDRIERIDESVSRLTEANPAESVNQLRGELASLRARVVLLPSELVLAARESVEGVDAITLNRIELMLSILPPVTRQAVIKAILILHGTTETFDISAIAANVAEKDIQTAHFPNKVHAFVDSMTKLGLAQALDGGGTLFRLTCRGAKVGRDNCRR